jgi:RimJ/RimL family protein N-acetyltransferase
MKIRHATPQDATALLALKRALDRETTFMMFEPDERTSSVDDERRALVELLTQSNSTLLIAEGDGEPAGYLAAEGGAFRRNRHSAYLTVGVRQRYAGQGIGTALFQAVEAWAREQGLRRLELTVMTNNAAGLGLYRKMGFVIEGTRHDSVCVDGVFIDEYAMAKLLDEPDAV